MPQQEHQERRLSDVTNINSPLSEAAELPPHAMDNNNSAKGRGVTHIILGDCHAMSKDESALKSPGKDGPQSSQTDWMVFDKETADSDRDTMESKHMIDVQMGEKAPERSISLAQQDYEMQLRLLEAQNKRRLRMALEEQSKRNIQSTRMQINIKGPPEPIPMGVMGSTTRSSTVGGGNMMATLPSGAPYFVPGPRQHSAISSPMAMKVNSMATVEAHYVGRYNPGATDNAIANGFLTAMPVNSPKQIDPMVLFLQQQIKVLQNENQVLRWQLQDAKGVNFAVFHCILGQEGEKTYLEKPYWVKTGENLQLKAESPVLYPDAYILYKPLTFVIYKYYSTHVPTETREALRLGGEMPDPEPSSEVIKLVSEDIRSATKAFAEKDKDAQKKFRCLYLENEMQAPYLWWYYYRDRRDIFDDLPQPQAELMRCLTSWIDGSYSELYSRIDDQFKRGMVSAASINFLVQPGDVLVRKDAEGEEACIAMSWLHKEKNSSDIQDSLEDPGWTLVSKKSDSDWEVDTWSYVYNSIFYRLERRIAIHLGTDMADTEIPIVDLNIFPLRFASQELRERLERRGKTFWSCRHGNYISYNNNTKNQEGALGQHYLIDCRAYKSQVRPKSTLLKGITRQEDASILEYRVELAFINREEIPSEPDLYIFPRTIIGYDLQQKKWDHLNVDLIQEVTQNKNTFSHIVADAEIKELSQALFTTKIAAESLTSTMQSKGYELIMLLHGGPGPGKAFTAESVVKLAEKPLIPVACGKIGTSPNYLDSMLHLAKIWGCVVLFEEAELVLEQRSMDDTERNTLVSDLIRAIESYDGILIFTSKIVDAIDEAFKSRIQLSLQYESLAQPRRVQIWRDFLRHLNSLDEKNIDFEDVDGYIGELAERELNEHQICNAITTARQLAQFQGKTMAIGHLRYAVDMIGNLITYPRLEQRALK